MLVCVTFNVVMRGVWICCGAGCSAGKRISKEEGDYRLAPSSTMMGCVVRLKLCGCRRQTVPSDIIIQHGSCGFMVQMLLTFA